jgi:hypothetical protein
VTQRALSNTSSLNVTFALALWQTLDPSLYMEPLNRLACATPRAADACVGVTVVGGDCVCYNH